MPKTKSTSRNSAKKQQSKVKRAVSWFKPTRPAKGMLLFALVVALAGGAYAIKKSFAASWTQYPPYGVYCGWNDPKLCQQIRDDHASKGVVNAVRLNNPTPWQTTSRANADIFINNGRTFRYTVCFMARAKSGGPNASVVVGSRIDHANMGSSISWPTVIAGSSYKPVCSSGYAPAGSHVINADITSSAPTDVYVGAAILDWTP